MPSSSSDTHILIISAEGGGGGDWITIPIHDAYDNRLIGRTRGYQSNEMVSGVRQKLLDGANVNRDKNDLSKHIYVEVVLRGSLKEEGDFLDDLSAPHEISIGDVSKLVYWDEGDIKRASLKTSAEVKERGIAIAKKNPFVMDFAADLVGEFNYQAGIGASKLGIGTQSALNGRPMYYQGLLAAREARDTMNEDKGLITNYVNMAGWGAGFFLRKGANLVMGK